MTKTCIICKRQPIPHDKTRSFHKFPVNPDLKNKWMSALKLSNITNNSRVCSDHFPSNSYHETDNYRTLKRLLSDAVPFLQSNERQLSNNCNLTINNTVDTDESIMIDEEEYIEMDEDESLRQDKNEYLEIIEDGSILESTNTSLEYTEDNTFDTYYTYSNNKRSIDEEEQCILETGIDVKLMNKKKIRFMDGYQTKYISRSDFVSTEAWYRFLKLISIKNSQIKASQKKSARREEKLLSYKQLIKTLADKKVTIAAKYLQDTD